MPVYEYYCEHCHGVFEKLMSVSRASDPQPCPECDEDARRLMPTTVNSFVVRDGIPRRIPDTGKFWHHEQIVDRPVNTTVELGEHPDLYEKKYGPERPPTAEEEERFADEMMRRMEAQRAAQESGMLVATEPHVEHQIGEFIGRRRRTANQVSKAREPNSRVTPRTASGEHVPPAKPSKPARGSRKKSE